VGVVLTPIIRNQPIALDALREKVLAVDGNGELYQFLALIRLRDGTPLRDAHGRVTSHLSGLFFRATRLIAEYSCGSCLRRAPPPCKAATLEKRREVKRQFEREHAEALARGDLAEASRRRR
jgi:flap endonuclease-1